MSLTLAAVTTALMGQLRAGDHVVASKALFGSCRYVVEDHCPRYGITSTLVDGTDLDQWRNAVRKNTKAFFLESPTNPVNKIADLATITRLARSHGALTVLDETFVGPRQDFNAAVFRHVIYSI